MSYEGYNRKGTSRERQARALVLNEELEAKIAEAQKASEQAETYNEHVAASRLWRRVVHPATRLGKDTTIYREAVQRHVEAAESLRDTTLRKRRY